MRKTALNMVHQLASQDERVVFIGSDLGTGTLNAMKEEFPDRFFIEGISEANVVSMAAGMAMEGKIVYVNTIATFLTRRCFEQNVLDLGLHNTNVRLIANGGGVVYAPLGPTHEAIDDLAIMRTIPNMTVVAPCDAREMTWVMEQSLDINGPCYIRLAKGYDPIIMPENIDYKLGKPVTLKDGSDVLLVTTGITAQIALEASEELLKFGIEAKVLHFATVKPLDSKALIDAAQSTKAIITIEEHTVIGGLGGAVAEILMESDDVSHIKFRRIGIEDIFPSGYGSQKSLMARLGISTEKIVETSKALVCDPMMTTSDLGG